ncbi:MULTISPECIES: metallophosphoesterase [Anaerostipes]|uniref:metallophosphoesterase n=1 Tax=Anaerostipes TaxID=207244 RepID=UPI000A3F4B89|nr:metallophosphoesterase [Anaerostipes sp. 494a]
MIRTIRRSIKRGSMKRTAVIALSAMMLTGGCFAAVPNTSNVQAATEHWNDASTSADWKTWKDNWEAYSSNYENVSLTPGVNQSQLNFAWYSKTEETPKVRIADNKDMTAAVEYEGKQTQSVVISDVQYYSNKATVKDLKENTTYYYQVFQNGQWQDAQKYSVKSFKNYSFLYVGDPQIGASKGQTSTEGDSMSNAGNKVTSDANANLAARNDSYNWNKVLNQAVANHSNVSFIASAGDQVNYGANEREYAGYLGAEALRSLPVATTIGNHDSSSNQYSLHYNNPNSFDENDTTSTKSPKQYTEGKTAAGTDYYYTYGNTLFIVLDTNNYNCATHENVIRKAVKENKDAKWKVVMFHQDIYGSGYDHSDSDGMILRTQLTPLMDKYDIDVVLQGHDHTYSRTYQLQGDGKNHTAYNNTANTGSADFANQNNCYEIVNNTKSGTVVNPEGTVYLEANSATGSKFYNLIPTQQDFISERSQSWTPTYSVVNVTDDSFEVTVYDATTGKELEGSSTYKIVKKAEEPKQELKEQKITGTSSYTKVYGSKPFALNAKTNGNGKLSYTTSNKNVATVDSKGNVTIKGTGKAVITVKASVTSQYKSATKNITITVVPKKQSVSVSNKIKKALTIKWKKDSKASGYEIVYATNSKFSNKKVVSKNTHTSVLKLSKLKKGKKYYVKARSFKTVSGKRYYGSYSTTKKVTVR